MKHLLVLMLLITSSAFAQPDPVELAEIRLGRINDSLILYPDSKYYKKSKQVLELFLEEQKKILTKNSKATYFYVNNLLETDRTDTDFTKTELYQLRGDFKLFEEQNYTGAIEDYVKILSEDPHQRKLVYEQILQVLSHKNELAFNSKQLTQEEHEILKNKIPLEASVFRQFVNYQSAVKGNEQQLKEFPDGYVEAQRVVFFQRVYELVKFYNVAREYKKTIKILDVLCLFTRRDQWTNTYDFDNYCQVYQLLARIYTTAEFKNNYLFLENLYLYVGSPIGQTQEIDADILSYFYAIKNRNQTWHYINSIINLRIAYYSFIVNISKEEKATAIKTAETSLYEIERLINTNGIENHEYVYFYLKAIMNFEFDGNTEQAYENINKALALNKYDFYVFEYKTKLLKFYETKWNSSLETKKQWKKTRENNALLQHQITSQFPMKTIPLDLIFQIVDLKN